ncbi:hypothetical protein BFW38_01055 [Terasakiispira papahanaumokuakeensis]|uniref:Phosphatase n=1 Tax=Terasakiispira papahanaumokuakeensis TaxID=197479 RepID=A0A1E2V5T7_9GAMM|nr:HAD family hydrolase [Terasakiispira papahanaumokuakeensis]ODC02337.1 hypothetical protein BFW38_01055 [Terasakiispira papahanaumokuakeensis]
MTSPWLVSFDLDGTLVDSQLDFQAIRQALGFPDRIGLLEHMTTLPPREAQQAAAVIHQYEMAGAAQACWMPGAQQLVSALQQQAHPIVILTRNTREAATLSLSRLGLSADLMLTREDCAPKPDPEGLHRIAQHFEHPVNQLVYVGDFIYDLETAHNAGAIACLYRYGKNHQFSHLADWVIDQLPDLLHKMEA